MVVMALMMIRVSTLMLTPCLVTLKRPPPAMEPVSIITAVLEFRYRNKISTTVHNRQGKYYWNNAICLMIAGPGISGNMQLGLVLMVPMALFVTRF